MIMWFFDLLGLIRTYYYLASDTDNISEEGGVIAIFVWQSKKSAYLKAVRQIRIKGGVIRQFNRIW